MDLPPPPPLFRRHHFRYENVLRPPDFVSPPCPQYLPPPPPGPPPPHARSLNIHLPPQPPPPSPPPSLPPSMRHLSPPPPPPRFAFSPIIERSNRDEFDPPPKPYFHPTLLPPPPPPPPRGNVPSRIVHDYPKINHILENEKFHRARIDNIRDIHENWDQNLSWDAREVHTRAPDIDVGCSDRYRDVISENSEWYRKRDDGRRQDSGISNWGSDLDIRRERDYDERRWDRGIRGQSNDLYRERDYNRRRWDSGMNDWSCKLHREHNFDERRWNSGTNERSRDLHREHSFEDRRWDSCMNGRSLDLHREHRVNERRRDSGMNDRLYREHNLDERRWENHELYNQVDDDERRRESSRSAGVLSRLGNRLPEFAENVSIGGVLSRLGNRQPEFAENDLSLGGVLSRLGNRQPEFAEDDQSLGRFSGRLGTVTSKGEFIRSDKKKRLLKKNTLNRTQLGKVHSKHSGGFKSQHFAKESSTDCFKVSEKGSGKMQARMEDNREREQSPMELTISFKSNSLVAKAIQVPSHPSTELSVKSNSMKERLGYNASTLPAAKPDVISNIQFDSWGTSKEHMEKASNSGSGSVTPDTASVLSENPLKNAHLDMIPKGSTMDRSEETRTSWSWKKKRGKKQPLLGANLLMEKDNHAIKVDPCKPFVSELKRKRSRGVNRFRAYEVARQPQENLLPNESADYGDSLGFNQHVNIANKYAYDKASVIDTEKDAIEPTGKYIKLGSDREHGVSEHPNLTETVLLERSYTGEPSEDTVPIKDHDSSGLSRLEETRISEVHENNYFSEIHDLGPSLKSGCAEMKMTQDAVIRGEGLKHANSPKQASTPHVMSKDFSSIEGDAATYCPNIAFDISISTCFLSADDGETSPEFEVSFPDSVGTVLSHNIYSVEGGENSLYDNNSSPKVITDRETCISIDNSSKVVRKRKHGGAQMDLSCGKTDVDVRIVKSIDVGVARCLAKDIAPAIDGDFVGERDSCKEDTSLQEGTSDVKDSLPEVHFFAEGSFLGYQKKQKIFSPRSSLSSFSEDDTVVDELNNPPILEQHSSRPSEWGAEQSGDASSTSTTILQCGTTDVEGEVDMNNLNVVNLDENLVDGNRSFGSDDLALIASGMSNGPSASDSGDESLASSFDMRSCMTSPEGLHVYSDSCLLGNTKVSDCLLDNEMICQSDNISNKKHVCADPNTSSLGKCLSAAVNKSQSNPGITQFQLKDTSQVVKKLYPVHGKLTWSKDHATSVSTKVLPGQHPLKFSNTAKLYSSNATKSRTWCRTVYSTAAVAEPKSNPSSIPQSNETKAARSIQSSYVRKGNSLVRKTPSDDTSHGFHGSSSSVYRFSRCTNTMKNDLATDYMADAADALTRRGRLNTSEMKKTVTLNQSENSLSRTSFNLEEPLPASNPQSNDCLSKTLDVMEESIKSSPVPERHTDPVINSDSQSTTGVGNSDKKIIYVKRRSNQLVATSSSDDMSILEMDNTQSQSSDGYYKSKENQLLRASSENHVKGVNANSTASRLVPHPFIPKTSTRRQSGFAKTSRYSKLSSVWKLHDTQSSEKYKNFLGPRKVWPHLFSPRRAAYWRSLILGMKPSVSNISQKLLVSRKRGAIYTRSSHGYSLKMSKVLSVGGSSLKWSKSIEKSSRKANEEATRAVAAAEKRKKEEKGVVAIASKSRNHVSRERIFRIGSERYKMDPTRRTLQRITEKESSSSSVALQSKKTVKRSYIPRRLLICNEEYVRIGNGNQLVRDPKKRIRVLASEKVRWSLRTARLRLAKKRKYCQFFTRFGKCNKVDGKCPYIHDPSKIAVCTKFLTGSCTNINCKLTHKIMPERMQDCSYFLKGSCSNESCPYRHVHVNPDSSVCESFLRGYCADGNECPKKHTYACPAFEATGLCPQASTCKLHHPKKKPEKKPTSEQKVVRGRYFDGGLVGVDDDCSTAPTEKLPSKGKDKIVVHEEKFPDYISLEVSDDEILPDAQKSDDELSQIIVR